MLKINPLHISHIKNEANRVCIYTVAVVTSFKNQTNNLRRSAFTGAERIITSIATSGVIESDYILSGKWECRNYCVKNRRL